MVTRVAIIGGMPDPRDLRERDAGRPMPRMPAAPRTLAPSACYQCCSYFSRRRRSQREGSAGSMPRCRTPRRAGSLACRLQPPAVA